MTSEYSARYASDEHHAWTDIQERWAHYMERRPHHEGVLEVNLSARTAVLHFNAPDQQPLEFHDIDEDTYRRLMRSVAASVQEHTLEIPVVSTKAEAGVLTWAGVSAEDETQANLPDLAGTVDDLSLRAQLGWKAADMALRFLDHIKADQQTNYMSGNGPALHPIKEAIRDTMADIEGATPTQHLHQDHEYVISAQVLAILDATQTKAETGGPYRLADGRNRIANLRTLCAQREEAMAALDGTDEELHQATEKRAQAEENLARTRAHLKQAGIATAIAMA